MTGRFIIPALLVLSALSTGCEGKRPTEPLQPNLKPPAVEPPAVEPPVLTTLEVTPSRVTLDQGWTVHLETVGRDQRGTPMNGGREAFSSSDSTVAKVNSSGFVTGVTGGAADILVSRTI